MIGWLQENLPYGHYAVAPHQPPLPYPDQHFDLVINHGVFTHLDERFQDLWLEELRRISAPGALLLLTVEGTASWNRCCAAHGTDYPMLRRWKQEIESRGLVFIRDDTFVGSTHPDFYHSTFHAPWYIFEHWSQFFDVVAYLPEGSDTQDLVVLRRREDAATAQPAIPSRPGRSASSGGKLGLRAVRTLRQTVRALRLRHRLRPGAIQRELSMLRAGLYEQSNRISVIAAELRAELEAERHGGKPAERSDQRSDLDQAADRRQTGRRHLSLPAAIAEGCEHPCALGADEMGFVPVVAGRCVLLDDGTETDAVRVDDRDCCQPPSRPPDDDSLGTADSRGASTRSRSFAIEWTATLEPAQQLTPKHWSGALPLTVVPESVMCTAGPPG